MIWILTDSAQFWCHGRAVDLCWKVEITNNMSQFTAWLKYFLQFMLSGDLKHPRSVGKFKVDRKTGADSIVFLLIRLCWVAYVWVTVRHCYHGLIYIINRPLNGIESFFTLLESVEYRYMCEIFCSDSAPFSSLGTIVISFISFLSLLCDRRDQSFLSFSDLSLYTYIGRCLSNIQDHPDYLT